MLQQEWVLMEQSYQHSLGAFSGALCASSSALIDLASLTWFVACPSDRGVALSKEESSACLPAPSRKSWKGKEVFSTSAATIIPEVAVLPSTVADGLEAGCQGPCGSLEEDGSDLGQEMVLLAVPRES